MCLSIFPFMILYSLTKDVFFNNNTYVALIP